MRAMNEKEKNFISAVVYIRNDEERVSAFLEMLIWVLEKNFEHSEIICVNDCSEDGSPARIRSVSKKAESTSISVVNMSHFHGRELAMNGGVDLSIGDFVLEFDNTLPDFGEEEIMRVYKRALEGYDIVFAAPDRKERYSSRLFYRVFAKYSNFSSPMRTESFHIVSRRLINRIMDRNTAVPYRKAVYLEAGLRADTVVYEGKARKDGLKVSDKRERRYRASLALDSLILFTDVASRFSFGMTVLLMLLSVVMTVYSVIVYVTASPVAGWTTTILFLSVAFFGLFGVLTVIIKYLQLLVNLVFKRKQYSFESIEKLTK